MIRNRNAPRGPEVDRADAAKWVEALEKELANPTATAYSLRQHARDGAAKVWLCLPKEEEDAARARLRDLANQLHERAGELENDDRRGRAASSSSFGRHNHTFAAPSRACWRKL
jgi:flagellar motor switch protein FliG